MNHALRVLTLAMFALAVASPHASSMAADYPARAITLIVPFPAGGSTDLTGRLLASYFAAQLGPDVKIVVENRPGASGQLGFTALADARPDGYTLGLVSPPPLLSIPIERAARFNLDSFDLIGNIVNDPAALVVREESPIQNLKDLIDKARADPGAVTVGSSGNGTDDHLSLLRFEELAGITVNHVPFAGGSPANAALIGGHIDVVSMNVGDAFLATGGGAKLRILGQMARNRGEFARGVPTFAEQGFPLYFSAYRGLAAPAGLPPAVRTKLVDALANALKNPEFLEKARATSMPISYMPPQTYRSLLENVDVELKALWKTRPWTSK